MAPKIEETKKINLSGRIIKYGISKDDLIFAISYSGKECYSIVEISPEDGIVC